MPPDSGVKSLPYTAGNCSFQNASMSLNAAVR